MVPVQQSPEVRPIVLVVDDDPGIRTLLGAALQMRGYECEAVPDGTAAIQALSRRTCCVILLDLLLPQTNGFDVIRYLKANRPEALKRTIVMTAAQGPTLRDFGEAPLLWAMFHKPFDLFRLLDCVRDCVDHHAGNGASF